MTVEILYCGHPLTVEGRYIPSGGQYHPWGSTRAWEAEDSDFEIESVRDEKGEEVQLDDDELEVIANVCCEQIGREEDGPDDDPREDR